MFSLIGIGVVVVAVFGGYLMESGELALLMQPAEFLIIWGAALGSLITATPVPVMKRIVAGLRGVLKGSRYTGALYLDTLKLFYELFQGARKKGLMALEKDVERPIESDIFTRHRAFMGDSTAVLFVCDTLRMSISGGIPPHDLDMMIEGDLEVLQEHQRQPVHSLSTVADALPGLGIVAAVLGIVITMSSLGGPPEELGHKVAAALVGTFLGVLTCYGLVGPLAGAMTARDEEEVAYFRAMKAGLVAFVKGHPPMLSVEFTRRQIPHDVRPSFLEMEKHCKNK